MEEKAWRKRPKNEKNREIATTRKAEKVVYLNTRRNCQIGRARFSTAEHFCKFATLASSAFFFYRRVTDARRRYPAQRRVQRRTRRTLPGVWRMCLSVADAQSYLVHGCAGWDITCSGLVSRDSGAGVFVCRHRKVKKTGAAF